MNFRNEYSAESFNLMGLNGLHSLLGLKIIDVQKGQIQGELIIDECLFAGNGFVHAGAIITLADTTCGYGCLAHLPEHANSFTTLELKSNFLSAFREGTLHALATIVHEGRSTQVWDAQVIHKESNRKVAIFRCTQMILYPR